MPPRALAIALAALATGAALFASSPARAQATASSTSDTEIFVPPQGGAAEIPLHVGTACILSFPDKLLSKAVISSPDFEILAWSNPLRYQLVTDDPGVGIAAGSTEYSVSWTDGVRIDRVLDWTSVGAGAPLGTSATRFPVGIFSEVVPGLATKEGQYVVEFRATDRLARTTNVTRCFVLALRAPPLEVEAVTGARSTKDHAYALDSLSLAPGVQYDQIAARLLNDDATGASLIDQDVWNGTTAPIYLTVTVTPPQMVLVAQQFALGNAPTNVIRNPPCFDNCPTPSMLGDEYTSPDPPQSYEDRNLTFPVKVFELVNGQPTFELPCLAPCSVYSRVFRFVLPPRGPGGRPAKAFRVMTMIGPVTGLWPRDLDRSAYPPFVDEGIVWTNANNETTLTRLTGKIDTTYVPERTGCVSFGTAGGVRYCRQLATMVPYRALLKAELRFSERTGTRYETSATVSSTSAAAGTRWREAGDSWTTSEGAVP